MFTSIMILAACATTPLNNNGQNTAGENSNGNTNNGNVNNPDIAVETPGQAGGETVMCTMDAKMCPDGSYVGRTGPNCEFAACPGEDAGSELTVSEAPQVGRIMSPESLFQRYMEENIAEVSDKEAVLGGNWSVSNIENTGEGSAVVDYEDGHIAGKMEIKYEIVDDKVVIVEKKELES